MSSEYHLVAQTAHKQGFLQVDKQRKKFSRLLVTPFLHDKRIYLGNEILTNTSNFMTSFKFSYYDCLEYNNKLREDMKFKHKDTRGDSIKKEDDFNRTVFIRIELERNKLYVSG